MSDPDVRTVALAAAVSRLAVVLLAVAFKLAEASVKLALTLRGELSPTTPFSLVLCQRLADDSVFSRVLFPRTPQDDPSHV